MKKLFLVVMSLLLGFLFAEIVRRPKMKWLQGLETKGFLLKIFLRVLRVFVVSSLTTLAKQ